MGPFKKVQIVMLKLVSDCLILPFLTYGCDVWGSLYLNNLKLNNLYHICEKPEIAKAHLKYMKFILGVHSKSANDGVRGELVLSSSVTSKFYLFIMKQNNASALLKTLLGRALKFSSENDINLGCLIYI